MVVGLLALLSDLYHLIWCPWDPILVQERPWGEAIYNSFGSWEILYCMHHKLVWEWDRFQYGNEASELTCFVCRWQVKIEHSRRYLGLRRGAKVTIM